MRLWHKDLIPYLPRQQLLAQWRECCAIISNIANKGTPNHLLVNKILDYPICQFWIYSKLVIEEMEIRGYKISSISKNNFQKYYDSLNNNEFKSTCGIFENWHNERYLKQCLFNLQEKYDCGGISEKEWLFISNVFGKYLYN